jgi:hypothetical protein
LAEFYNVKLGSDEWLFNMGELKDLVDIAEDEDA